MGTRSNNEAPIYFTSDKSSPAYTAVKDEWPKIVTGAIDDVHRTSLFSHGAAASEGKKIIAELGALRYEVLHNRQLTPLPHDGHPDNHEYNTELEALGPRRWFDAPWLFAECYLFRRIHTIFCLSTTHWNTYDVFARQKFEALLSSRHAIREIVRRYTSITAPRRYRKSEEEEDGIAQEAIFTDICTLCLASNNFVSPFPLNSSYDQGNVAISQGRGAPPLSSLYQSLKTSPAGTISIRLSTAPVPVLLTLLLSIYLLESKAATKIILNMNSFPWSVTGATHFDVTSMFTALADPEILFHPDQKEDLSVCVTLEDGTDAQKDAAFYIRNLQAHAAELNAYIKEESLIIREASFWTTQYGFEELPARGPELWKGIQEAEVVIFTGMDGLERRKITGGRMGAGVEEMFQAWGGETSGVRVLMLGDGQGDIRYFDGKSKGTVERSGNEQRA